MNKKIPVILIILALLSIAAVTSIQDSKQDFDGLFEMKVPLGQHYRDVAYCLPNGALGCIREYWEDNAGCQIEDGDIVVYYYNNSLLVDGESNAFEHAIRGLTTSYLYKIAQDDGHTLVLTNDIGMKNMPPYLVGKSNGDGSKVVFVGGNNLGDLKSFADSIEFK